MSLTAPKIGSEWRRKSDGRVDTVKGHTGRHLLMYSPATNRHWHLALENLRRKYAPAEEGHTDG